MPGRLISTCQHSLHLADIGVLANVRFAPKPAPGTKIVSVAALPEPQTAIRDLGGRRALSVFFWLISYGIRSRARRAGISYRYLFMHPSGSDLAQLAELIAQGKQKE